MRAEVTQVEWDGALWRRSLNTAGRSDARGWQQLQNWPGRLAGRSGQRPW
jgi:hypothetical protein